MPAPCLSQMSFTTAGQAVLIARTEAGSTVRMALITCHGVHVGILAWGTSVDARLASSNLESEPWPTGAALGTHPASSGVTHDVGAVRAGPQLHRIRVRAKKDEVPLAQLPRIRGTALALAADHQPPDAIHGLAPEVNRHEGPIVEAVLLNVVGAGQEDVRACSQG